MCEALIPNRLHFIWFGEDIPVFVRIAISSARRHNPEAEIFFWHSHPLPDNANFKYILSCEGAIAKSLSDGALFEGDLWRKSGLDVNTLARMVRSAGNFTTRSNIARAAVLYRFGGIYLDADTLVIQSLVPLRKHSAFLGTEDIVWPGVETERLSWYRCVGGRFLSAIRSCLTLYPHGYRLFKRVSGWYNREVNGAVWGAEAAHPCVHEVLRCTALVPHSEWGTEHRLGTHILQSAVAGYRKGGGASDLTLLPPACFYPLGPKISRHYFRSYTDIQKVQKEVILPTTYVLHWYASVTALRMFDNEGIQRASDSLFGRLCSDYV